MKTSSFFSFLFTGILIAVFFLFFGCKLRDYPSHIEEQENDYPSFADEMKLLDDTFRIDILSLDVTLTYHAAIAAVDGRAVVRFRMRPGQVRPRIHFDPAVRGNVISGWQLDGKVWDNPLNAYSVVDVPGSTQKALEFSEDADPAQEHVLKVDYRLKLPGGYPCFTTNVHDLMGKGNEELFPTLNVPHELALHRITLRIDSSSAYRCIGSGFVQKTGNTGIQEWLLDTEREVASYTVMFVLLPEADTLMKEGEINGIPVRMVAFNGGAPIPDAWAEMEAWLPKLTTEIGPFPMPRGLSVFLVSEGGGMEYFGGTISSPGALSHEVFHMYFACSTIPRTYRDSWMDEAIVSWYDMTYPGYIFPIQSGFKSNMVSGRSPVAVGFDMRAYTQGEQIMETLAQQLGGRAAMTAFLSEVYHNHAFSPFGTMELAEYYHLYSGIDMETLFRDWFFNGSAQAVNEPFNDNTFEPPPDLTPPEEILEKYGLTSTRKNKHGGDL